MPEEASGTGAGPQPGLAATFRPWLKPLAIIAPPSTEEVGHHPIFILCKNNILVTVVKGIIV